MKVVFINALRQTAELPFLKVWESSLFDYLFTLPDILGVAVRLLRTEPEQERVFVMSRPFTPVEFLSMMDWADQLNILFDIDASGEEVYNCKLPDHNHGVVIFAPFITGHVNLGELVLVTKPLSPKNFSEWSFFCDQFASLLLGKIRPDRRYQTFSSDSSSSAALDFLLDVQRLTEHSNTSSPAHVSIEERWSDEDVFYLYHFLSNFQSQFDLDTVFAIQRISPEHTQVVIASWVDKLEELHPAVLEMLENLLEHEGLPALSACNTRIFSRGRRPPEHRNRDPWFRSFPCGVDENYFGHLGVFMHRDADLRGIYRLMALLANHLGFRFSHLFQERKEELHARLLQQINFTCNLLTASADVRDICRQVGDSLPTLFGQFGGAILHYPPGQDTLEVVHSFGPKPTGYDLIETVLLSGIISDHIHEGSAFRVAPDDQKNPVRFVFPFCPTPNLSYNIEEPFQQRSLGGLVLYNIPENRPLNHESIELLKILLNGVSAALLVARNYQEKMDTIKALERLIWRLGEHDESPAQMSEGLMTEVVDIIRSLLNVNRCSILTLSPDEKSLVIRKSYGIPDEVLAHAHIPIGSEISGSVAKNGKSIRIDNIEADVKFQKRSMEAYFNRSLLSVPLLGRTSDGSPQVVGVINVNNKINGLTFTDQDQQLLESIAHLLVVAQTNVDLMENRHERERIGQQIRDAHEVQMALLPRNFDAVPGSLRLSGRSLPARQIGGDFYDAMPLPDGRYLAAIGDVSGKGMPAAILMAGVRMLLRMVAIQTPQPARILDRVNELITKDMDAYHFVTLQIVAIDPKTGDSTAASAGHGPLLSLISGKTCQLAAGSGMPLGIHPVGVPFRENAINLKSGDMLMFTTDGLSEERGRDGEMFGTDRVSDLLFEMQHSDPEVIVKELFNKLDSWRENNDAHDDRTVLVVKFLQ
ncbi:MAG: SpoIIE family protein phosphatase [Candidatus Riflebacteria bacterium]|nr:SpoIIE family protein phosphatase [Candidatus Riflebacteria bacterium]